MNKLDKLENYLFFMLGLFSTWMAAMIFIGKTNICIFNFILIAIIVLEIAKNRKVYFNQKLFLAFCILSIISTIGCYFFINDLWFFSSLRSTLKFLIVFVPFLLFVKKETILDKRKHFIRGLYFSVIFQLIWEFLEVILWSAKEIPLNKVIFGDFLKFDIERSWLFWSDGRMRPTGLSWEPANLALSLIIGYILSKNKTQKVLFIIGIILSTSRIGIGAFCIIFALDMIKLIKERYKAKKDLHIKRDVIIIVLVFMLFILSIFLLRKIKFLDYIYENINSTIHTIIHISQNPSANRHLEYYYRLPEIYSHLNLFQILFGVGVTCAGYPYSKYLNIYSTGKVWTPETDYLSILLGNGLLGFIFYFYWLFGIAKKNIKNYKLICIIIAILVITTMSQFYRGWVTLLLILFGVTDNKKENGKIENYNIIKE